MKKLVQNHFKLVVALALVCSMAIAMPTRSFAADASTDVQDKVAEVEQNVLEEMENVFNSETADPTSIEPRAHVSYYPSSGVNSGVFYGAYSANVAVYKNLPSGTMKFAYSMSGGGTCYLLFFRGENVSGSPIRSAALNANDYTGTSSIYLPVGGPYTVQVYYPNGNANTEITYAFNLYRD